MSDCCNNKACDIEALRNRQGSILKIVLAINAVMFLIELTAGLIAGSVSLLADSLDMLGDTLVYGFSIYVIAGTPKMKAHVALLKGGVMAAFGVFVLAQVVYKIIFRKCQCLKPSAPLVCWHSPQTVFVLRYFGTIELTTLI